MVSLPVESTFQGYIIPAPGPTHHVSIFRTVRKRDRCEQPPIACYYLYRTACGKGVAGINVSGFKAGPEPLDPLCGGPVSKAIGNHLAARLPL
jgi:hypothetical protein